MIEGCSSYLLCFFTFVRLFWEHDCWLFYFLHLKVFCANPLSYFSFKPTDDQMKVYQ